jgi:hypothetical protein
LPNKHLFIVLSNITQLVVEAYLNENPHFKEDSIILYPKRFKPKTEIKIHYYPYFDDLVLFNIVGKNFIKKQKQVAEIHNYIKEIIGENTFVLYAPHFYINTLRIVSLMKQCIEFKYIEEGTLSYMSETNILVAMPDVKLGFLQKKGIGFSLRSAYPDKDKEGISISEFAFPFLKHKLVIKKSSLNQVLNNWRKDNNIDISNCGVLVVDSTVENKVLKLEEYLIALMNSIVFFKENNVKKVYFKFHPDQNLYPLIDFYRQFFKSKCFDLELEELPQTTSLELIFMTSKNLTVIHTMSSLGFYSKINGHKAISNASALFNNVYFKKILYDPIDADFHFEVI